jgi:DNA-binding beta-propeller fold protein YncE
MNHGIFSSLIILGLVFFSGCDTSGLDPPSDQLINPDSIVTTANEKYLLVVNANFDLKYNAGTMTAISLSRLKDIIESGGKKEWESEDGEFMYVPSEELIDANNTIRLAAYASDLELTPNKNRALIPIRGGSERHVLIVDVDESAKNGRVLNCGQDKNLSCDSAHRVTGNSNVSMPIEPHQVTSIEYERTLTDENNQEVKTKSTIGFVTHWTPGSVSAFRIENSQGELDATLLSVVDGVVKGGAIGIGFNPTNNELYVTGAENQAGDIAVMQVLEGAAVGTDPGKPFFGVTNRIDLRKDLLGGTDTRGIAVSSDGAILYAVTRDPEALLRVDTKLRQMVDITSLGAGPSNIKIIENEVDGKTTTYAFIVCYESNQVFIVNTDNMVSVVRTTGIGPNDVAFDKSQGLAFVANLYESTISVFQSLPPFDHVRVGKRNAKLIIGIPRYPDSHN